MYASEVKGQRLTFFVSGKLWGASLVMGDKETGSEWSHILGESMAGPLNGETLAIIPSAMTTWQAWLEKHPDTTATMIQPTARDFDSNMLKAHADWFGLGLVHSGKARFWRFDYLTQQPLVNEEFADIPVVVHFDSESQTPIAWSRRVNEKVLAFRANAQGVQDEGTESTWDLQSGLAKAGPLKGTRLEALPAIVSFTRSWQRFHPETTVWKPDAK